MAALGGRPYGPNETEQSERFARTCRGGYDHRDGEKQTPLAAVSYCWPRILVAQNLGNERAQFLPPLGSISGYPFSLVPILAIGYGTAFMGERAYSVEFVREENIAQREPTKSFGRASRRVIFNAKTLGCQEGST